MTSILVIMVLVVFTLVLVQNLHNAYGYSKQRRKANESDNDLTNGQQVNASTPKMEDDDLVNKDITSNQSPIFLALKGQRNVSAAGTFNLSSLTGNATQNLAGGLNIEDLLHVVNKSMAPFFNSSSNVTLDQLLSNITSLLHPDDCNNSSVVDNLLTQINDGIVNFFHINQSTCLYDKLNESNPLSGFFDGLQVICSKIVDAIKTAGAAFYLTASSL